MFWIWFMVIGGYTGKNVIKGCIIIIILSVVPSLWAIGEYLDSSLYSAMYQDVSYMSAHADNPIQRLIFDAIMTLFTILFPMILIYMVANADGPNVGGLHKEGNSNAGKLGGLTGGTGSGAKGGIGGIGKTVRSIKK